MTVTLSPAGPAVVWTRDVTITGTVSFPAAATGVLFVQGALGPVSAFRTQPSRFQSG